MPESNDQIGQRLEQVESAIMHLQHDFESLNEMLLHQQKAIGELRKSIEKLSASVETLGDDADRNPEDERPPHY